MMIEFPIGPALPEDVLERARTLPLKPAPVTLERRAVRLMPLDLARDVEALHAVSNGMAVTVGERSIGPYDPETLIWRYLAGGPFAIPDELAAFLRPQIEADNGLPLCVFDRATGRQVGVVNYMTNFPAHLKIELGNIWYSPIVQRTQASLESTYLMLTHAFALGYRRVEWKCDALNERSRRSALRMGFQFEGIQEAHFIIKGRNRDTAWFRILDREWPEIKARLEAMLGA
jgi:RimJ/RimL family protein N-acetyltransferase